EQKRPTRSVRLHALPPTMWIRPTRGVGGTKTIAVGVLPATITWTGGTVHLAGSDEAISTGWEGGAAGTKQFGSIHLARAGSGGARGDKAGRRHPSGPRSARLGATRPPKLAGPPLPRSQLPRSRTGTRSSAGGRRAGPLADAGQPRGLRPPAGPHRGHVDLPG